MALGRGVQAVDRLGGDVERGVEPERDIGAAQVVVDRLGNSDHVHAVGVEPVRHAERVLAADRDEAVQVEVGERLADLLYPVFALVRVRPRAAQDRAAPGQDPAGRLDRQLDERSLEHTAPAVAEAD